MARILLLGAGFSKNWGGLLAGEAFNFLMSSNLLDEANKALLLRHKDGSFEAALDELQAAHFRGDGVASAQLAKLEGAVAQMFEAMDSAFRNRAGFEFSNDVALSVASFLARFDAIFTLNQDVLLERYYMGQVQQIRVVVPSDEATILALIREVAAEIPILIEPDNRWRLVKQMVRNHCADGGSWVAVGDDGAIAGFLLAEPDEVEQFFHDDGAVYLAYAGVAPAARGMGTFTALARQAMGMQVPLTATVNRGNTSDMVGRFQRLGFVITAERLDGTALAWRPGA